MIKKSLGQNFFVNENLGEKIINFVKDENPEIIVEIGPGRGFFTHKLSIFSQQLVLIEKDDILAEDLKISFPNAIVLNQDFLDWNFKELEQFSGKKIIFYGSLPYNISKPIIQKIISSGFFSNNCYFIIQKEVAEKYVSKEPNNNILSLRTQLYAKPKKLMDINPGAFMPRPKVMSSVIKFSPIEKQTDINEEKFIKFIENCFRSPRKTLRNNLKNISSRLQDEELFNKRPQELTLEQYIHIFTNLS
ncbi:MAG: Ribosomal RNA small subunit methyltransferase A [candidate division WS6 bacterium GW2011_WS6_36_26]|uniref:Ribosomal RNA small subunit methyltransferase A n=2 Tax=Bacteria candidate phyla TaxID=1783234 RepID=A0A0G0IN00_9BACT|nr:MAG: Ribosomal RNA small subunit methyltransferase A [candidate division WS6 bacterium GW2011_WS6_36_26]KKQ17406.1 MAG: Ribosomal RNA small subunit methyltransferase A [candidate division WS6 bacterium GW2011_GWF1_36_8]OGI46613.1 MAG: ribosomal RNA small subunit methyltransferase A [Candidatus Nomurabacteria bacterium GWB1_40_6]HAM37620.1 ribosomal RNA small subunit methyltransferase A [Patescibacteria group bacterium]HAM96960.1 ribosomal RNA small subunit methyltransferase A [Patescibacteri